MLDELVAGLRLALRRWPIALSLAGMIAIASAILAVLLGDVLSQSEVLRGGVELRRQNAVVFTPYYLTDDVSNIGGAAESTIESAIDSGKSYTSVIGNVEINDPNFADGVRVIVIVGEAPVTLFPELRLCSPAPCAMRGAKLADKAIAPIKFAGQEWRPDAILEPNATYFDPSSAGLLLDDIVVLHATAAEIQLFDDYEREEAAWRLVMLSPTDTAVASYVTQVATGGTVLVPQSLKNGQSARFRNMMIRSGVYISGLLGFLLLVLITFHAGAREALRREQRAIAIRRLYGASRRLVAIRVAAFLAVTVLFLPVILLLLLRLMGRPVSQGADIVLAGILLVYTLLCAGALRRQNIQDPIGR